MYDLHFDTTKDAATAASIHRAGCLHGRPRTVQVVPLGESRLAVEQHSAVADLRDRGWTVRFAPCTKGA